MTVSRWIASAGGGCRFYGQYAAEDSDEGGRAAPSSSPVVLRRVCSEDEEETDEPLDLSRKLEDHPNLIYSLAFSLDGQYLACGGEDGSITLWDFPRRTLAARLLQAHAQAILCVVFGSHATTMVLRETAEVDYMLATGSHDDSIKLWGLNSFGVRYEQTLLGHSGSVLEVKFHDRLGNCLISASADRTLKIWDWFKGDCLQTLSGHTDYVRSVDLFLNGTIVSGSDDGIIKLWSLSTGKCLQDMRGHTNSISKVRFSPDGLLVASGSRDRSIRLWEVFSGQCLFTFHGHADMVTSISFSKDGLFLASGSYDGTIKVWDVKKRSCTKTCSNVGPPSWSVEWAPAVSAAALLFVLLKQMKSKKLVPTATGAPARTRLFQTFCDVCAALPLEILMTVVDRVYQRPASESPTSTTSTSKSVRTRARRRRRPSDYVGDKDIQASTRYLQQCFFLDNRNSQVSESN